MTVSIQEALSLNAIPPRVINDLLLLNLSSVQGSVSFYDARTPDCRWRTVLVLDAAAAKNPVEQHAFYAVAKMGMLFNSRRLHSTLAMGCCQQGWHYAVRPLLPGFSLQSALEISRRKTETEALRWGLELAEALDFLHQAGFVHRKLDVASVFLDEKRHLVLGNWSGVFDLYGRTDFTGFPVNFAPCGSRAPELLLDGPRAATPASDVFSLGCLLLQTQSGNPPFEADSVEAILARQDAEGTAWELQKQGISHESARLISMLLDPDPAARLTAREFAIRAAALLGVNFDAAWTGLAIPRDAPPAPTAWITRRIVNKTKKCFRVPHHRLVAQILRGQVPTTAAVRADGESTGWRKMSAYPELQPYFSQLHERSEFE